MSANLLFGNLMGAVVLLTDEEKGSGAFLANWAI